MNGEIPNFPESLRELPEGHGPLKAGFSGGPDSHALIHWLVVGARAAGAELTAVHVDHSIHPESKRWADWCRGLCTDLGVHLDVVTVDARPLRGESPEEAARRARYLAFEDVLRDDEILVLAHHQDDQAETILLQLLRGAGPSGLAGMPRIGRFRHAWVWRPFIDMPVATLRRYSVARGLVSIQDPSNDDRSLDRSFLRHELLPVLRKRWPSAGATLSRAARHCAESKSISEEVAAQDLDVGMTGDGSLGVQSLLTLGVARRRNLLRFWLHRLGMATPSAAHMLRIETDLLGARADRAPTLSWANTEIRRFRGRLFAMQRQDSHRSDFRAPISGSAPIMLPDRSSVYLERGGSLSSSLLGTRLLEVGFRQGGERLQPPGSLHHRTLKHLYQEAGVPPWERDRRPLLLVDGVLAAVAGLWIACDFVAPRGDRGLRFTWQRPGPSVRLKRR